MEAGLGAALNCEEAKVTDRDPDSQSRDRGATAQY